LGQADEHVMIFF